MIIDKWMEKLWLNYNRIPLSNIKELTVDINNHVKESQNSHADWKKPDKKEYRLYDYTEIKF